MKLSSKTIFSPGHSKELPPQIPISSSSSSSSFNKKLVTNGQASPMFPTVGRKRGSGFDNPEPSSPKVTCIGQVRVKAKKRGAISKSKTRSGAREASFRRLEVGMNPDLSRQKSQRIQSFQQQNNNLQQQQDRNQRWVHLPLTICEALKELSCLFPCKSFCTREREDKGSRWMFTIQKCKRDIELVMGEEEQEEERTRHRRRHVFENIDLDHIEKLKNEGKEEEGEEEEEEKRRVSLCIPPKNALLLMRCRSDPIKVAALSNKLLDPTLHKQEDDVEVQVGVTMEEDKDVRYSEKCTVLVDNKEDEAKQVTNEVVEEEVKAEKKKEDEDANDSEKLETICENDVVEKGSKDEEVKGTETEEEKWSRERENRSNIESGILPECLLLMMCEPKLSTEVSKETWVCTADFVRWLPPRSAAKTGSGDRQDKKRVAVESKQPLVQPPPPVIQPGRLSCSFTVPVVGPNVCEPDVLKRCKSEPRGSAAAKVAPEGCFWNKNRKLMEPYSSARLGISAAGVGF
ncbi:hypothetical protein Lal_00019658 [Lupinus albus]|uniref:Uncharacterized protein n=1 Tax=Lupinus albus TaxID=3870 RepID=A0A6A4R403_LUPAL|nr:hypothetical protein Lalb_Chr01g0006651 [Lupinus albus]KAF1899530.1 hypothetical protein Lal_00019658 [Lupinus albus]